MRPRPSRSAAWVAIMGLALVLGGCGGGRESGSPPIASTDPPAARPAPPRFRAQDLPFRYETGLSGLALPVETTGGGVAMLDYDGDGDLDLFFPQGVSLKPGATAAPPSDVLLRNDGPGTFTDVSARVGLTPTGSHGQGVTVADYDGDGDPDIYVTRYGPNTLWRNDGGIFRDVTAESGVGCPLWSLGAAFLDYDNDGDLDLFVVNYFSFDPAKAPFERDEQGRPQYGVPSTWNGDPDVLYRNDGDGTFTDVTAAAGVAGKGRGMGVLAADFDADGRIDVLVANDAEPNDLWRNKGDGTFENVAMASGIAVNGDGRPEANMGIVRGDTDGDGEPDVFITHFFDEHDTLWCALPASSPGTILFDDRTKLAGLGTASRPMTGWGVAFADLDADGLLDIAITNGHIRPEPHQTYRWECPPLLWRGAPKGRFEDVSATAGPYFSGLHMGRGLASGDLDNDGDLDLVIVHYEAPSVVLWNDSPALGGSVFLDLIGRGKNRDAIGARLTAKVGERTLVRAIEGGGGYLSTNDHRIHLGIGPAKQIDRIEVRWPSGTIEARENVPAGSRLRWAEGERVKNSR